MSSRARARARTVDVGYCAKQGLVCCTLMHWKAEAGGGGTSGPPGVDRACRVEERRVHDSTESCGMAGGDWPRNEAVRRMSMRDRHSSCRDSFMADKITCEQQ
jgi:hypothetical protein